MDNSNVPPNGGNGSSPDPSRLTMTIGQYIDSVSRLMWVNVSIAIVLFMTLFGVVNGNIDLPPSTSKMVRGR